MTNGRAGGGRSGHPAHRAARSPGPRCGPWTRAPAARRAAGSGPLAGGQWRTGQDELDLELACAGAAVSWQWFDQCRPDVIKVSAPSASAAPTGTLEFR
jgi:hypothetical protein